MATLIASGATLLDLEAAPPYFRERRYIPGSIVARRSTLLGRLDRFAVTVLAAGQRALAGRFAASGRPGARLLLDGVPHQRGTLSGALIPAGGLAAVECEATQRVEAGDHLLVIARVLDVPYLAEGGQPLIRFRGKYPPLPEAR